MGHRVKGHYSKRHGQRVLVRGYIRRNPRGR